MTGRQGQGQAPNSDPLSSSSSACGRCVYAGVHLRGNEHLLNSPKNAPSLQVECRLRPICCFCCHDVSETPGESLAPVNTDRDTPHGVPVERVTFQLESPSYDDSRAETSLQPIPHPTSSWRSHNPNTPSCGIVRQIQAGAFFRPSPFRTRTSLAQPRSVSAL
jgi:hypothetical protein